MPEPHLLRVATDIPEIGAACGDWVVVFDHHIQVIHELPREAFTPAVQQACQQPRLLSRAG